MKNFIYKIRFMLMNIWDLFSLRKSLNETVFQTNPITYYEMYEWVKVHGVKTVRDDLKKMWDTHNDHDVWTL